MSEARGFYGVALFEPKTPENLGTVMRNCGCFSADFVCIIGGRYEHNRADTMKAHKHLPVFEFKDLEDFLLHVPFSCEIVVVEVDGKPLNNFIHPERAIYLFGGEDRTVPEIFASKRISLPTKNCLNMAVTTGIILYDRTRPLPTKD